MQASRATGIEAMIALFQELAADDPIEVSPWETVDIHAEGVALEMCLGIVTYQIESANRRSVPRRASGVRRARGAGYGPQRLILLDARTACTTVRLYALPTTLYVRT